MREVIRPVLVASLFAYSIYAFLTAFMPELGVSLASQKVNAGIAGCIFIALGLLFCSSYYHRLMRSSDWGGRAQTPPWLKAASVVVIAVTLVAAFRYFDDSSAASEQKNMRLAALAGLFAFFSSKWIYKRRLFSRKSN